MKYLLLFFILSGCATREKSFVHKFGEDLDKFPDAGAKVYKDVVRCALHLENKKILISLDSDKKKEKYCLCILTGFMGFHEFKPHDDNFTYIMKKEREYNEHNLKFMYYAILLLEDEFNKFDATVNAMSTNPKMYKAYLENYESKVNYCAFNANIGIKSYL